jgi:hypothetical protein
MATAAAQFNINTFKAQLKNGGARPNQFEVIITFPGIPNVPLGATSFLISVAELPGQTIGVAPVYYRGREIKLAGDKVFAPFTCTVLNDTDFTIRHGLEQWMQYIESNQNKTGWTNPARYQSTIDINQLDRQGTILRSYKLNGAFPTDISPIGLDFAANDQLSTFGATFQYQDFTMTNGAFGGLGQAIGN